MKRRLGSAQVNFVGLGCMSLSHAYGVAPSAQDGARLLHQALDLGYDHLDTASLYGGGANEALIGETLSHRRNEFFLASKCGMSVVDGVRRIDGRPELLRAQIDASLTRLKTDHIDLYYLHRWDKSVPIEESVGELSRMIDAGKISGIGLSEVSAATLRKAHATHAITAVQNEYSLWSRNAELGILDATRDLGVTLVAFSPVARGFLADGLAAPTDLVKGDIRAAMPRFSPENFAQNVKLLDAFRAIAQGLDLTPAQLCLQWLASQGDHVVAIPGTTSPAHLAENFAAPATPLDAAVLAQLDTLFTPSAVAGHRYPDQARREIDTEDFA